MMTLVVAATTLDCIRISPALSWFAYKEAVSERVESLDQRSAATAQQLR